MGAVALEDRYKGVRSPHKMKMAVSGCLRECAEAQGKDLGLIATQKGYNMYVCGNGGARPMHAALLATDIDEETCLKYADRFLMFYISTAKHLQRTANWLEELPGGIEYLKQVVIQDKLGICAELEALMAESVSNYKCEWKEVVYDEDLQKRFQQYVNTTENMNTEQIEYIDMRKQRHPNTYDCPDITGPAPFKKEAAPEDWEWVFAGKVKDYASGGLAVKHGNEEVAVFHLPKHTDGTRWLATQNTCPHKQVRVISRGLVGVKPDGQITLADPVYKTIYDLQTGNGLSNPALDLSTFQVMETSEGDVMVKLPPAEAMEAAFKQQAKEAADKANFKAPSRGSHPDIKIIRKNDKVAASKEGGKIERGRCKGASDLDW